MKILVTGGVRSGKSAHAESLLPLGTVTYVAPGPVLDDADWAARIAAHRSRRPADWATLETGDLSAALQVEGPILVDCLGTWLTRLLDDNDAWDAWDAPSADVAATVNTALDVIAAALAQRTEPTVIVTNEVGWGVVPEHRSGRLFRDLLGTVNQRIAAGSDEVHLVIAGRVLKL